MHIRRHFWLSFLTFFFLGRMAAMAQSESGTLESRALDTWLDRVRLESALVIDQNDTVRHLLSQDPKLRSTLLNLNHLPADQLAFVNSLNERHKAAAGSQAALWDQEYTRFMELRRSRFSTDDDAAIRTWTNGIVNTWSPGARRRIVSKVLAERKRHREAAATALAAAPGKETEAETVRATAPGLDSQAAEQNRLMTGYQNEHQNWNQADWTRFGRNVGISTAVAGGIVAGIAKLSGASLKAGSIWTAAVGLGIGAIAALISRSTINDDHARQVASFNATAQQFTSQAQTARANADALRAEAQRLRSTATAETESASYYNQTLDVIPQGRAWDPDRENPPAGPGMDGLERTDR